MICNIVGQHHSQQYKSKDAEEMLHMFSSFDNINPKLLSLEHKLQTRRVD
jgi:hypothetical protein